MAIIIILAECHSARKYLINGNKSYIHTYTNEFIMRKTVKQSMNQRRSVIYVIN